MNDELPEDLKNSNAERVRLEEWLRDVEKKLADSREESDRLRGTVVELTAKVGRLDARLRRIHRKWGFRLLNAIFGYEKDRSDRTDLTDRTA